MRHMWGTELPVNEAAAEDRTERGLLRRVSEHMQYIWLTRTLDIAKPSRAFLKGGEHLLDGWRVHFDIDRSYDLVWQT